MFAALRSGSFLPRPVVLAIVALALAVRLAIPAGWMPIAEGDGTMRVTICSGMGAVPAWIDRSGRLHEEDPSGKAGADQPCAFAGLAMAGDLPALPMAVAPQLAATAERSVAWGIVTIGRGLAAPPPPQTGPPAFA